MAWHKKGILTKDGSDYTGGITNWRVWLVNLAASIAGLQVKIEGFPVGTNRNVDLPATGEAGCSSPSASTVDDSYQPHTADELEGVLSVGYGLAVEPPLVSITMELDKDGCVKVENNGGYINYARVTGGQGRTTFIVEFPRISEVDVDSVKNTPIEQGELFEPEVVASTASIDNKRLFADRISNFTEGRGTVGHTSFATTAQEPISPHFRVAAGEQLALIPSEATVGSLVRFTEKHPDQDLLVGDIHVQGEDKFEKLVKILCSEKWAIANPTPESVSEYIVRCGIQVETTANDLVAAQEKLNEEQRLRKSLVSDFDTLSSKYDSLIKKNEADEEPAAITDAVFEQKATVAVLKVHARKGRVIRITEELDEKTTLPLAVTVPTVKK